MSTLDIHDVEFTCRGKTQYRAYSEAEKRIKHGRRKSTSVYKCPFCRYYHVGGTGGRRKINKKDRHKVRGDDADY